MLQDKTSFIAQKKSLDVLIELYYKNVWYDEPSGEGKWRRGQGEGTGRQRMSAVG